MIIQKKLFIGNQRKALDEYISGQITSLHKHMTNNSHYSEDDHEYMHKAAMLAGTMTCLQMIRYLCVDNKGLKPWIVHTRIEDKLDFNQLKEYSEAVVHKLSKRIPHANYGALVHTQTIISVLTTMEYRK